MINEGQHAVYENKNYITELRFVLVSVKTVSPAVLVKVAASGAGPGSGRPPATHAAFKH